jgi:uncharacterized membrane protein
LVIALPPSPPEPSRGPGLPPAVNLLLIAGVVVATGLAVVLIARRRGRGATAAQAPAELDYRDEQIIEALRSLGGRATAQELMRKTGIPKTPLYRRLSRLEEAGLIKSSRVRGVTYYHLAEETG